MTEPTPRPGDDSGPPSWFRNTNRWLWALGALVVVAVIAAVAIQAARDDDDDNSGSPTATQPLPSETATEPAESETVPTVPPGSDATPTATTPGGPEPDPPAASGGATGSKSGPSLTVDRQNIVPQLNSSLTGYVDHQVEGKNLKVISVVDQPRGVFWTGPKAAQRLLVELNLKGRSAPSLKVGQVVAFVGAMHKNEGTYGVTRTNDLALLDRQGAHAFVSVADLHTK